MEAGAGAVRNAGGCRAGAARCRQGREHRRLSHAGAHLEGRAGLERRRAGLERAAAVAAPRRVPGSLVHAAELRTPAGYGGRNAAPGALRRARRARSLERGHRAEIGFGACVLCPESCVLVLQWALQGSNLGPTDYESAALTT